MGIDPSGRPLLDDPGRVLAFEARSLCRHHAEYWREQVAMTASTFVDLDGRTKAIQLKTDCADPESRRNYEALYA